LGFEGIVAGRNGKDELRMAAFELLFSGGMGGWKESRDWSAQGPTACCLSPLHENIPNTVKTKPVWGMLYLFWV